MWTRSRSSWFIGTAYGRWMLQLITDCAYSWVGRNATAVLSRLYVLVWSRRLWCYSVQQFHTCVRLLISHESLCAPFGRTYDWNSIWTDSCDVTTFVWVYVVYMMTDVRVVNCWYRHCVSFEICNRYFTVVTAQLQITRYNLHSESVNLWRSWQCLSDTVVVVYFVIYCVSVLIAAIFSLCGSTQCV